MEKGYPGVLLSSKTMLFHVHHLEMIADDGCVELNEYISFDYLYTSIRFLIVELRPLLGGGKKLQYLQSAIVASFCYSMRDCKLKHAMGHTFVYSHDPSMPRRRRRRAARCRG